jgi:hypothetical protein
MHGDTGFIAERASSRSIALDRPGVTFGLTESGSVIGAADVESRADVVSDARAAGTVVDGYREHGHRPG